jgi:hypothetical protein
MPQRGDPAAPAAKRASVSWAACLSGLPPFPSRVALGPQDRRVIGEAFATVVSGWRRVAAQPVRRRFPDRSYWRG